ncbi:MAG: aminoacyl-tRNA hydrolase [Dehalococcoidales bacterium]|jgi:PTH1 family peptidyl-tRNA hydrolase|nr:aminoacyl-tRNA hydrolase [Dehalococcoidales bacterium]
MKLIVGLGNPGKEYSLNRHNIGFICLDFLANKYQIKFDKKQCRATIGTGVIAENEVILAKPQTYMNASGQSVILLLQKYNINPADIIVIHDDLDLPLGKIRIRQGSSSAGHKGVESIIAALNSKDFIRVRIGIGRPEASSIYTQSEIIDYVLGDFTPDEMKIVELISEKVSEAVFFLLKKGLIAAMNKFNS